MVSFESLYEGQSIYYTCWWLRDHVCGWNIFLQFFCKSYLFVFLHDDPSAVDNAQGRGPSGWLRTSLIWSFLISAINIIWMNRFLSASRMISLDVLFRTCTLLFSSVNVCSFALVIVTWNLVWGGCYPSCFTRKVWYAFSPTALAISKSCCISGGASFPVERQTRSCCTLLNGSSQWLWRRYLTSVSSLKNSGSLEIGVLANWFAQV